MQIGQTVIAKVEGKIRECVVEKLLYDDVILLVDNKSISRKYWEVRKLEGLKDEKEN